MGKQTPLLACHLDAGAKIAEYAGWDMPIQYGSQLEEHQAVRRDAGMFDVSHMGSVDVAGADAKDWLRHMLANDVAKLILPGKALFSCLLREDGGIIDDLIVVCFNPQRYRVVVNATTTAKDLAWMQAHSAGFAISITPRRDLAMIAVQGPNARARFWDAFPAARGASEALMPFQAVEWNDWLISRTGYTGEDGLEISLPAPNAAKAWETLHAAGVARAGLGARDTLRLEAGMNLYGQDMDETVTPLESGLAWSIDFKDAARDFIGKAALQTRQPVRQLVGLLLLERGMLRARQKVVTDKGNGETTSGSFAPTLNRSIALARVPVGIAVGDEVAVEIRGKPLKARVVKLPFVRKGKSLLQEKTT